MAAVLEVTDDVARVQPGLPLVTLKELLAARGTLLPARAHLRRRVRRRHHLDQRVGRGHLQVRQHARLGARPDRRAGVGRGARHRTRARCWRTRTATSTSRRRPASIRVPVPTYVMPDVPKRSAGYFAAPGMDLIDLFIGAEGTLGVIVEATLGIVTPAPADLPGARAVRERGARARRGGGPARAIEAHVARAGPARPRRVGDRDAGPAVPRDAPRGWQRHEARHLAARRTPRSRCSSSSNCRPAPPASRRTTRSPSALEPGGDADAARAASAGCSTGRACSTHVDVAVPGDRARAQQFFDFRESAPEAVKRRVAVAKQSRSRESRRPRPT